MSDTKKKLDPGVKGPEAYQFGFHDDDKAVFKMPKGLNREVVEKISEMKGEPDWMREFRFRSLEIFFKKPMPKFGGRLEDIDFQNIYYYVKASEGQGKTWEEVPEYIKKTFDRLGIPEAERKFLAGVGAQYDSEVVYHNIREDLEKKGVIFKDPDSALREHPEIFKQYFGTVIPPMDNKFAALNSAVWSGGSFIYVPEGVHVDIPLQAYFRINSNNMGQFERTLIIAEKGSSVHYVEGCFTAGASVRARQGDKPVEEITVGDEVFTHKGRYRRVYHTMKRPYHGPIYRIRYYGESGSELEVTQEHPLMVVKRQRRRERNKIFQPQWKMASEVKVGDYLAIPLPKPEIAQPVESISHRVAVAIGNGRHKPVTRYFEFPSEADFYRLLGYYFSEGHVDNEHYLSLSFNVKETEYLRDAQQLLERYSGKKVIMNAPRQNGQTMVICSTEVARSFATEFGSTVNDKHIPEWIQSLPFGQLRELVRGMWCGDGSYDSRKNMFRYNTVSRNLAYGFRDALLRLGIAASIDLQKRETPRRDIYAVVISSPWNPQFGEIVGINAPAGSLRGSPFQIDEQYLYVPVKEILIEEKETTVYNFSVEEDESYVGEGVISHNCTAPTYSSDSLHSAVVEIIVKEGAKVQYTTIQNWSANVYNLVTKRMAVYKDAVGYWLDANIGSKLTMKYPSCYLMEPGARGEILSVAIAGKGQHQDAGGKIIHGAPNTSSVINSKSISKDGGRTSYRGLIKVYPGCEGVKSTVRCDALLMDEDSRSDTYPSMEIDEENVQIGHEATVSKVSDDQIFYLMSRGIPEQEATKMIVNGFLEPLVKQLPMEYAVELNRLVEMQLEGSVG